MRLTLEGHIDTPNATAGDVMRAVAKMARPDGPTFIVLESEDRRYCQAAGTNGRYVIESRTPFGEGFQHFRVWHPVAGPGEATVVPYRRRRPYPLKVLTSEVCVFADVERVMHRFATARRRDPRFQWRDVTSELLAEALATRPDPECIISLKSVRAARLD
jgi:hypothetical protein